MPMDGPPAAPGRLDPRRHLEADPLAARLLEAGPPAMSAQEHIRSRDPRARLDAAAAQLHGARADLPFPAAEPAEPGTPRRARPL